MGDGLPPNYPPVKGFETCGNPRIPNPISPLQHQYKTTYKTGVHTSEPLREAGDPYQGPTGTAPIPSPSEPGHPKKSISLAKLPLPG